MKIQSISRNNDIYVYSDRSEESNYFLRMEMTNERKEKREKWREEIEIMIKRVLKKGEKQEKKIGEKGWRR